MSKAPEHTDAQSNAEPVHSPFAGCLILVLAAVVVLGLAFFAWWTVTRQAEEIAKFTDTEAKLVFLPAPEKHQKELNTLVARLQHFKHEVDNKRAARLDLSPADLNLAIAAFPEFKELPHTFHVKDIRENELDADISFKLGSSPFSDRNNHLNADLETKPVLNNGQVYLEINKITSDAGSVPEPFRQHLSPYLITEKYLEDPAIGPVMKALTSVETAPGRLSLVHDPESSPPSAEMEAAESVKQTRNFMALVAIIVILSMILLFVLLAKRRRLKKNASSDEQA